MNSKEHLTASSRRRRSCGWGLILILTGLCIFATPAISAAAEESIHIGGSISNSGDWTLTRLRQQFASEIKQVRYASRGKQHVSNCVALLSVLKAAGASADLKMDPAANPRTKNAPLRMIVVVEGRDGYTVVFGLPELLPQIGNKPVWLALDEDGAPLSERDGPVKLIVPDDVMPGRWVHGIAAIRVEDMGQRSD